MLFKIFHTFIFFINSIEKIINSVMGCTAANKSQFIPAPYLQKLQEIAHASSPTNVNFKYGHIIKIDNNNFVGSGCFKTHSYQSLVTKSELQACRKEFWETRTNGATEIWNILKKTIETREVSEIESLVKKGKLYLVNNYIQLCVTRELIIYQIPAFILNEPLSYAKVCVSERNLKMDYELETVQMIIRTSKDPQLDFKITQQNTTELEIVKQTIKVLQNLDKQKEIRLFYGGKQLRGEKTLGNYGYQSGNIIQAIIS